MFHSKWVCKQCGGELFLRTIVKYWIIWEGEMLFHNQPFDLIYRISFSPFINVPKQLQYRIFKRKKKWLYYSHFLKKFLLGSSSNILPFTWKNFSFFIGNKHRNLIHSCSFFFLFFLFLHLGVDCLKEFLKPTDRKADTQLSKAMNGCKLVLNSKSSDETLVCNSCY